MKVEILKVWILHTISREISASIVNPSTILNLLLNTWILCMQSGQLKLIVKTLFFARKIITIISYYHRKLGTTAAHGIMAGYTDFSVGLVRNDIVMIPVEILVAAGSRKMKRKDYDW